LDPTSFVRKLERVGFEHVEKVQAVGEVARRGAVIDLFSFGNRQPIRVELWGESIDSIREFDVHTQRSTEEKSRVVVLPRYEHIGLIEHLGALDQNQLRLADRRSLSRFDRYPYFDGYEGVLRDLMPSASPLIDLLKDDRLVVLEWPEAPLVQTSVLVEGFSEIQSKLEKRRPIELTDLEVLRSAKWRYSMVSIKSRTEKRDPLIAAVQQARNAGLLPIVVTDMKAKRAEILSRLHRADLESEVVVGRLSGSFSCPEMKLALLLERELRHRPQPAALDAAAFAEGTHEVQLFDLQAGDYITHIDHGTGRFLGIERLRVDGGAADYLNIEYRGGDRLLVPVNQLNKVDRLVPADQEAYGPQLDKLGSKSWERRLARTRESLKKMTTNLLALYAQRSTVVRRPYPPDGSWEIALASSFPWNETPDQARAISETQSDLLSKRPMDRLVCGDVGFGKTEIALRAAFKVVMGGKQVAVLVPTTLLAEQHYATFCDRYSGFPVEVRALSRFRSKKEEDEILQGIASGFVDIVIGTHRVLSADVRFADLGLLIVDEEHRFGVEQKERIKSLRVEADSLAMTATPIPRTLQMAMSGIRDLSIISTPPTNRYPVATTVLAFSEHRIRSAIRQELDRGGQVFFVHNRVKSLTRMKMFLHSLVPEASIDLAHAQMREHTLERVMEKFYKGELDILLSTMIVESGLDLPNVNTIIVNRADRLGLAQLHQLRGRVGRGGRRAYAYFVVPSNGIVSAKARRRLRAARDHSKLGAGLALALRDMEIRGTGNLLGREQHGFVRSIGIENYARLLNEVSGELKGQERPSDVEVKLLIDVDAYLPLEYVGDPLERFTLYKRISRIQDPALVEDLADECRDRFGRVPVQFSNLLMKKDIELRLRSIGVAVLRSCGTSAVLTWSQNPQPGALALARLASALENRVVFKQTDRLSATIDLDPGIDSLRLLVRQIERLWCGDDRNKRETNSAD
jgi:transcription-repair coupling factor (superfamily II helicase)